MKKETSLKSNFEGFNSITTKNKITRKRLIVICVFFVLVIFSLSIGTIDQNQSAIWNMSTFIKGVLTNDAYAINLLFVSRIPRTVAVILASSALSIGGLIMQSISRNKFISPSTAGTADAATLGILASYIFIESSGYLNNILFAFGFAMVSSMLFIYTLTKIKFKNIVYVPLIGIMFGALISSISLFLAQSFGLVGVLNGIGTQGFITKTSGTYEFLFVLIIPMIIALIYVKRFSIVSMGEDFAKNLGVNYQLTIVIGLIIISLITSISFVVVGSIPFLGLIIPNLVSQYYGDNIKKTMIDVGLFGATFVLLNDIFGRLIVYPFEIPIMLTMGVTGGAIFLSLIIRRSKHGSSS